jgi:membrane-bound metal-dependent hydrolase YbcI (DUF457 family)
MMGRTHAASGLAAGAVLVPFVPVEGVPATAAWLVSCAGMALLPDLDQRGTTAARMWGPVSQAAATVVGFVSRGHRAGTHDAVLAPLILGGLAWWATQYRIAGLVLVAVAVGLAIRAIAWASKAAKIPWILNGAASAGAALALEAQGITVSWLPWAVVVGVLAHIAGDALTTEKVPIPLVWIFNRKARFGIPLADTNSWLEPVVTVACLVGSVWALADQNGHNPVTVIATLGG